MRLNYTDKQIKFVSVDNSREHFLMEINWYWHLSALVFLALTGVRATFCPCASTISSQRWD